MYNKKKQNIKKLKLSLLLIIIASMFTRCNKEKINTPIPTSNSELINAGKRLNYLLGLNLFEGYTHR